MNRTLKTILLLSFLPMLAACNQASTESENKNRDTIKASVDTTYGKNSKAHQKKEQIPDISKKHLLGKGEPSTDSLFKKISVPVANREGLYLRKEALKAFRKMRKAASDSGIELKIISAFRSFRHQKWIWDAKFRGKRRSGNKNMRKSYPDPRERVKAILNYSAMPGTSRHHWGTDLDINSVNGKYFESGKGLKVYQWLKAHAGEYGFCQTYTPGRKDGYNTEEWHWSYRPLANDYLENYRKKINYDDISGFEGSEYAKELEVIKRFVLNNINPECQNHK